jgi:hypothetical protein
MWDMNPTSNLRLNNNGNAIDDNESLGSIWMIPQNQPNKLLQNSHTYEAPLPPPISMNNEKFTQLLRPIDIGSASWSGNNNNANINVSNNNTTNNNNNINNNNSNNSYMTNGTNNKMKDPVGTLWAQPTPPTLPLTLQSHNFNLLTTNNKFAQPSKKLMSPITTSLINNAGNLLCGQSSNVMNQQQPIGATSNLQLFSDEFLSYLNMIN